MNARRHEPSILAVDWGTSSLRAYMLGQAGRVLGELTLPMGTMPLQKLANATGTNIATAFEAVFEEVCDNWVLSDPSAPIVACGMVGSALGWCEAPYLDIPFDISSLGKHLIQLRTRKGRLIHIVPGLIRRTGIVNVMRGEETQVLGVIGMHNSSNVRQQMLIGLPGTHSKWVLVNGNEVHDFETFMTGEVYAALCEHTLLGCTMKQSTELNSEAFDRGVRTARSPDGALGILSNIFSVRTLALTKELSPEDQANYLSGLLIGHEIVALSNFLAKNAESTSPNRYRIVLAGQAFLCARYMRALILSNYENVTVVDGATAYGLWQIGVQADLITTVPVRPRVDAEGRVQ